MELDNNFRMIDSEIFGVNARGSGDHAESDFRTDDFKFSFISVDEFNTIFKQVKRERQRKQEAKDWEKYLSKKQLAEVVERTEENKNTTNEEFERTQTPVEYERIVPNEKIDFQRQMPQIPHHYQINVHNAPEEIFINQQNQIYSPHYENEYYQNEPVDNHTPVKIDNESCTKQDSVESLDKRKNSPTKERDEKAMINTERKNLFKKLDDLRGKIVLVINAIIDQCLNDDPSDLGREEVDILRSKKRNSAFTSRFKRNYHYQLVCQINEIKKALMNESVYKAKPLVIPQRFVSSHQIILQALQALEKHLVASCTTDKSFSWLKEFIDSVCEVSNLLPTIENFIYDVSDNRNNVPLACEQLTEKIDRFAKEKRPIEVKVQKKKTTKKANPPQGNLWMYTTQRLTWKEKAADMAKQMAKKKNKRKGLNEEKPEPSELKLLKMEVKQREGAELRRHSRTVREEQVRTMMEIIPEETESENEPEKQNKIDQGLTLAKEEKPAKAKLQELIDCHNAVMLAAETQRKQIETVETKSDDPANVKVVYIKCENDENVPMKMDINTRCKKVKKDLVRDYRKAFKMFKSESFWYDENVKELVSGMTTKLTDEILNDVVKEIDVDHVMKKIIDLELKEI